MEFPVTLRAAIEQRAAQYTPAQLKALSQQLTLRYHTQSGRGQSLLSQGDEALAYAAVRMPATFGAVCGALEQTLPALSVLPKTLLDVGAGTGAASWAAASLLELEGITCFEREPAMRTLGQALMQSGFAPLPGARWVAGDALRDALPAGADMVLASYMLNEFSPEQRAQTVHRLWAAAGQLLVILEPGTPVGFALLREVRQQLLAEGAYLAAPCAHTGPCRLAGDDWCHFSARIARSRLHRLLKEGDVPYEDEKYAYLAFSKTPVQPAAARILRRPKAAKGQITLSLCCPDANRELTVRKRDGDAFKAARKAGWGDAFEY